MNIYKQYKHGAKTKDLIERVSGKIFLRKYAETSEYILVLEDAKQQIINSLTRNGIKLKDLPEALLSTTVKHKEPLSKLAKRWGRSEKTCRRIVKKSGHTVYQNIVYL